MGSWPQLQNGFANRDGRNFLELGFVVMALAAGICAISGCGRPTQAVTQIKLPDDNSLRDRIDHVVKFCRENRHMSSKDQAAWQVVHGVLAYGRDLQIYHDGKLVSALDYLLAGGQMRGWVLRKGDHGLEAITEPGSKTGQGHEDQWLGYLSQCGLSLDQPIVVAGQTYTTRDLMTQAQWDIYDDMEATWTLMGFITYLPLDAEWTAKDGTKWNIERIVAMETKQPLGDSACGGTHRMYALTLALNRYLAEGGKLTDNPDGVWEKANEKVRDAVSAVKGFQQPNGSFSTNHFERAATSAEINDRISSTGHVLEFLMVALNDDELKQPWVTRAVANLVESLEITEKFDLECGGLYHSAHALEMYRDRRFGPPANNPPANDAPAKTAEPAATQAAL